jgi:hypothetical protein
MEDETFDRSDSDAAAVWAAGMTPQRIQLRANVGDRTKRHVSHALLVSAATSECSAKTHRRRATQCKRVVLHVGGGPPALRRSRHPCASIRHALCKYSFIEPTMAAAKQYGIGQRGA